MATLLDLIQEYAELNEEKTNLGGALPPPSEERWAELKAFYDLLMSQEGLSHDASNRFTADDIRRSIANRSRLRVHTEMDIVFTHGEDHHFGRIANLSCGGALLVCDTSFGTSTALTLNLATSSRGDGLLPTEGQIVWEKNGGAIESSRFRYRIGVQFVELARDTQEKLDRFIVEAIENRLLSLSPSVIDPSFALREKLEL